MNDDAQLPGAIPVVREELRLPRELLTTGSHDDGSEPHSTEDFDHPYHPEVDLPEGLPRLLRFNGREVTPTTCQFFMNGSTDSRLPWYPGSYPYGCIGRVSFGGSGGTAFLVGPKHAVTASHVYPWNRGWVQGTFAPGVWGSSSVAPGLAVSVTRVAAWEAIDGDVCGQDIAVLELSARIGDRLGWFGTRTYDDDWEDEARWTAVGYPCDWGSQIPAAQFNVIVEDDDSDSFGSLEIETNADTANGMSGGPLFGWFRFEGREMPYAIGTGSGWEWDGFDSDSVFAGGNALTKLVRWARDNWV